MIERVILAAYEEEVRKADVSPGDRSSDPGLTE